MTLFNKLKQKPNLILQILTQLGKPIYFLLIHLTAFLFSLVLATNLFLKLPYHFVLQFFKKTHLLFTILSRLSFKLTSPASSPIYPQKPQLFSRFRLPPILKTAKFPPFPPLRPNLNIFALLPLSLLSLIASLFYWKIIHQLPSPQELVNRPQKLTTQILDRHNRLLFKIYQDENRTPVKVSQLPSYLKQAFIAIEDKDFYAHQGFSLTGIARAINRNLTRHTTQGGSTITQQLVKNALLSPEKTWERKLKELVLAIRTELVYDKDTILEMYLNEVGFGGPAYGIQEASQQYFAVNATDLNLAQAAFLAGLPKAPSKFSPFTNPQTALSRQKTVLYRMYQQDYISKNQLQQALNTKLVFSPPQIEIKAPHFVMYVRELLVDQLGEALVSHGGLKVTTSLDLDIQEMAQATIIQELEKLKHLNVKNGAALVTNPKTGEILAMVGSKNYFDIQNDGQVNLTTAIRQPGSSIKPINYALALENGYTPNSPLQDGPLTIRITGSETWSPKNYDNKFHGRITLRRALASSYNIPAVMLLAKNGVLNMANLGRLMGITTWDDPSRLGLSLTLGGVEVKMTDLAKVYGTFANSGITSPLSPILKIQDRFNKTIPFSPYPSSPQNTNNKLTAKAKETSYQPQQTIKPETAYLITDILSDNQARAPAFGHNSVLNIKNHQVAVKTGTSNDLRDNWTIGYTSDFLIATWVGNNDNSPMSRIASGITGASPIWNKITTKLLQNNPHNTSFTKPENLLRLAICTLTNTLTCSGCPTRYEYFIKGTEPKTACSPAAIQKILEEREQQRQDQENNLHNQDHLLTGASTSN